MDLSDGTNNKSGEEWQVGCKFNPWKAFYCVFIPDCLARWPGVDWTAKGIWGVIAKKLGKHALMVSSTQSELAELAGVSRKVFIKGLAELREAGLLETDASGGRELAYGLLFHPIFCWERARNGRGTCPQMAQVGERTCPGLGQVMCQTGTGDVPNGDSTCSKRGQVPVHDHVLNTFPSLPDEEGMKGGESSSKAFGTSTAGETRGAFDDRTPPDFASLEGEGGKVVELVRTYAEVTGNGGVRSSEMGLARELAGLVGYSAEKARGVMADVVGRAKGPVKSLKYFAKELRTAFASGPRRESRSCGSETESPAKHGNESGAATPRRSSLVGGGRRNNVPGRML